MPAATSARSGRHDFPTDHTYLLPKEDLMAADPREMLWMTPPRRGRTTGWAIPPRVESPGAVVATTAKPDPAAQPTDDPAVDDPAGRGPAEGGVA